MQHFLMQATAGSFKKRGGDLITMCVFSFSSNAICANKKGGSLSGGGTLRTAT